MVRAALASPVYKLSRPPPPHTSALSPPTPRPEGTRFFSLPRLFFYNSIQLCFFTTPHARGVLERGCSPSPSLVSRLSSLFSLSFALSLASLSRLSSLACLVSRLSRSLSLAHARTQRASVSTCRVHCLSAFSLSLSLSVSLAVVLSLCVGVWVWVWVSRSLSRALGASSSSAGSTSSLRAGSSSPCSSAARACSQVSTRRRCAPRAVRGALRRRGCSRRARCREPLPQLRSAPLRSAHLSSVVTKVVYG